MPKVKGIVVACWIFACGDAENSPFFNKPIYDQKKNFCIEEWPKQWMSTAYSTLWLVFIRVTPVTIMSVLYSRVFYTLWFKQSEHQVQGTQLAMLKSSKRVTKMLVIVSIVYCVCWFPIYALSTHGVLFRYGDVAHIISVVLVTYNSSINPFIYTHQSKKFRRHLKELVCCRKYRQNRVLVAIQKKIQTEEQPSAQ
jgi:hypothetical protein